jgi:hypothetical protein
MQMVFYLELYAKSLGGIHPKPAQNVTWAAQTWL